jgi:uncharacterized membrane protein
MTTESRLEQVEGELAQVTARLHRLEAEMELPEPRLPPGWGEGRWTPPPRAAAEPPRADLFEPAPAPRPAPLPTPLGSALDFEALFGGRVLAWIGGFAILVGAVLFLGMAVSRGWLDEEVRTIIATVLSLLGIVGGIRLHDRHGRTEAAQAMVAASLSGLFATIAVATQAYGLVSPGLGLLCGALVAALGFAIAIEWRSPLVAAVGSLGAIGAPLLTGVGTSGTGIAFVAVALAASVAILVWQRWDWLALGAFAVSAPQLVLWAAFADRDHLVLIVAVLLGFWLLYAAAALGYELRARAERPLPVASWLLLLGSCLVFVVPGYVLLDYTGHHPAAVILLFGFAALQAGLGVAALRLRVHRELGSLLIAIGLALAAFGLGAAFHGPALVFAWATAAVALAALGSLLDPTPVPGRSSAERMLLAAGAFLALAVGHTLTHEAPPSALFDGVPDLATAAFAIASCAAAIGACGWFARPVSPAGARVAGFAAATALVYLGSVAIVDTVAVLTYSSTRAAPQTWLSAFWTVTGLGAVIAGLVRRSADLRLAGLALLAVAIGKVWTYDLAELDELSRVLSFVGLGILLLVGAFAYQRIKPQTQHDTGGIR